MTYSLQYAANNLTYNGKDLSISSTTGILSTTKRNIFSSEKLKITVTSTFK
jgi:hypothetical protein